MALLLLLFMVQSGRIRGMEAPLNIDVATLDTTDRGALEEVIGRQLAANQRLVLRVMDVAIPPRDDPRPAPPLQRPPPCASATPAERSANFSLFLYVEELRSMSLS